MSVLIHIGYHKTGTNWLQRRFFSDPEMTGAAPEQRWPVPLVLKVGSTTGIREERVVLADTTAEVTLAADATAADIQGFVAEKVASYKHIRKLTFVDAIPKSASGKILRRVLRDQATH